MVTTDGIYVIIVEVPGMAMMVDVTMAVNKVVSMVESWVIAEVCSKKL